MLVPRTPTEEVKRMKSQSDIFDDAVGDVYHALEILESLKDAQEDRISCTGETPKDEAIQEKIDALEELHDGLMTFIDTEFDPNTLDNG
jgi:cephalosporin-C deacetylase-like acetyl esterase